MIQMKIDDKIKKELNCELVYQFRNYVSIMRKFWYVKWKIESCVTFLVMFWLLGCTSNFDSMEGWKQNQMAFFGG